MLVPWPANGDRRFAMMPPREQKVLSMVDVGCTAMMPLLLMRLRSDRSDEARLMA